MIARYYRSDVGWCEACTGVDFGGVCSSINTKLETIRSQPHFWRNETDSAVFTQWCVQYLPSVFLFSIRCLQSHSRLMCKYFLFLHCFFTFSGYFFFFLFCFSLDKKIFVATATKNTPPASVVGATTKANANAGTTAYCVEPVLAK